MAAEAEVVEHADDVMTTLLILLTQEVQDLDLVLSLWWWVLWWEWSEVGFNL